MPNHKIINWYQMHVASLFNPQYGTLQISVTLERTEHDCSS